MANRIVTQAYIDDYRQKLLDGGYPVSKWLTFCERYLQAGYQVRVYRARRTVSKYVTISRGGMDFKVRFSNHRPIKDREAPRGLRLLRGPHTLSNFHDTGRDPRYR